MRRLVRVCLVLAGLLPAAGCTPVPPPVTPAEGVVLLNDAPLPGAQVTFVPQLDRFGAEMNSTGTTDDKGRFTLTCAFKGEPGAAIGKHKVLVSDAPMPAAARGPSQAAQEKATRFLAGLKNCPIPPAYATVGATPLTVDVTPEQKTYTIKLTR